jgi:hypothetical protein
MTIGLPIALTAGTHYFLGPVAGLTVGSQFQIGS